MTTRTRPTALAHRALYEAKTLVARHPPLALPIARLRGRGYPFGHGTQIVIEGFPRSATSFAVSAFELPQPTKPDIAHHVHAPAQLIAAGRAGVPALLLVRDPEDAILSLVIRRPEVGLRQVLKGYVRFHQPLVPHRDRLVVATFDQVVTDFGRVMDRVNRRFGTAFVPFEHSEENVRRVLDAIDDYTRPAVPEDGDLERVVARPSDARASAKDDLRPAYRGEAQTGLRRRAEALYAVFAWLAQE